MAEATIDDWQLISDAVRAVLIRLAAEEAALAALTADQSDGAKE